MNSSPLLQQKYPWIQSLTTGVNEDYVTVSCVANIYRLTIKIFVTKNCDILAITLYSLKNGDELKIALHRQSDVCCDMWTVCVDLEDQRLLCPFSYRFKIVTEKDIFFYDAIGIYKYRVSNAGNFKYFYHAAPKWVESSCVYQIFVDRFAVGEVISQENRSLEFFGGDLINIIRRLDYIADLGVDTISLTPIFRSATYHRYDVEDYFAIDKKLGGDEAILLLSEACRKKNIKLMLDGVFNHVSANSDLFIESQLRNSSPHTKSSGIEPFIFHPNGKSYEAFWGDPNLPKLNYASEKLRAYIYEGNNSVVKHWLAASYNITGWRIDACSMIGKYNNVDLQSTVLKGIYSEVKKEHQNCYIFGEVPFDPSDVKPYSELDGITNYSGFYTPLVSWLDDEVDFSTCDFELALSEFRNLVGHQFTLSSLNFIGNHDKQRFFSVIKRNKSKYFNALCFLFLYPGVPCLYYGDEIGLHDLNVTDDSRALMVWDNLTSLNLEILNYTKRLISIFKFFKSAQKGNYRTVLIEPNLFAFERFLGDELLLVIIGNSGGVPDKINLISPSTEMFGISTLFSCLAPDLHIAVQGEKVEVTNVRALPIVLASIAFGAT